jgi:hypothetical protein
MLFVRLGYKWWAVFNVAIDDIRKVTDKLHGGVRETLGSAFNLCPKKLIHTELLRYRLPYIEISIQVIANALDK